MVMTIGKLLIGATLLALFIGISNQEYEEEMAYGSHRDYQNSASTVAERTKK